MNSSIFRFNLDLHTTQSQISIPVMRGDTNREWRISFTDGENPVKLGEGSIATLSIKRPGGTFIVASCAIKDETTVVYNFEQNKNTAKEEGIHKCEHPPRPIIEQSRSGHYGNDKQKYCGVDFDTRISFGVYSHKPKIII